VYLRSVVIGTSGRGPLHSTGFQRPHWREFSRGRVRKRFSHPPRDNQEKKRVGLSGRASCTPPVGRILRRLGRCSEKLDQGRLELGPHGTNPRRDRHCCQGTSAGSRACIRRPSSKAVNHGDGRRPVRLAWIYGRRWSGQLGYNDAQARGGGAPIPPARRSFQCDGLPRHPPIEWDVFAGQGIAEGVSRPPDSSRSRISMRSSTASNRSRTTGYPVPGMPALDGGPNLRKKLGKIRMGAAYGRSRPREGSPLFSAQNRT